MMPRLSYNRIILLLIIVCVLTGSWFFLSDKLPSTDKNNEPTNNANMPSGASSELEVDGITILRGSREGWLRYVDPTHPFSFEFPATLAPTTYADETGDMVVFEDIAGTSNTQSFQIFITLFDEQLSVITPERIHKDIPALVITEPQEVILGNDSTKHALIFFSEDPVLGKTREVFIVDNMLLYQITARAEMDASLAEIMKTWQFLE